MIGYSIMSSTRPSFFFKNSYILQSTENVILRRSVINQSPPEPIFTKRRNMHVTSTKFHQNRKINVRSIDRNLFTPLIKIWGFHCVFCHETESHFVKPLRTPVPNLVQIGRNFRKYRKKANLNCEIRKTFTTPIVTKFAIPQKHLVQIFFSEFHLNRSGKCEKYF